MEFRRVKSVSLSTTESEWFALSETTKESIYLKHALSQLQFSGIQHHGKTKPMSRAPEDGAPEDEIIFADIDDRN